MRAAVFDGNNIFLKEVLDPIPSENQILIHVRAVGICSTDLAIVNRKLPVPVPLILGHEFAGEVISVGSKVDSVWINQRVTAEINTNICGKCLFCQRGIPTQCSERKALGIHVNGALAEYIVVESYLLHEIPDSISYIDATFIEPLAAAYQTFETMPLNPDDKTIAIFGMGKLGLLILQIARSKGLEVIAVSGSKKKLDLAYQFGAIETINRHKEKNIAKTILEMTETYGADIVVDATGNPEIMNLVMSSCRSRGKIHIKSTHGVLSSINITDLVQREITIYTSRCGPFSKAIQGLNSREIKVNTLISQVYPLEKVEEAFEYYEKNKNAIRVILTNNL